MPRRAQPSALRDALFRHRGGILLLPAAVALLLSEGAAGDLLLASPWLAAGLGLRAVAVRHLGPGGRTRDPAAPSDRVVTGPYSLLEHPLYVANVVIACGLLVALAVPPRPGGVLAVGVLGFYFLLAQRETRIVSGLRVASERPLLPWRLVARAERSTWLVLAALLALAL